MEQSAQQQIEQFHTQIKEFISVYRDAAAEHSISENEFWVWQTLISESGEHTQQELCNTWSLPKQTVNSIIAHMILKKYARLERKQGVKYKIIRLTEEGQKYGQALIHPIRQAEQRAFSQMSAQEFAQLIGNLQKYIGIIRYELANATQN